MADRAHMHMTIGGEIPALRIPQLVELAREYCCSIKWDGEPLEESEVVPGEPLNLYAMEIPGGLADKLEAFCRENLLPYSRWSGACYGAFNAEIEYFAGQGDVANYPSDDDARAMMLIDDLTKIESIDALKTAIAAATLIIPPLTFI